MTLKSNRASLLCYFKLCASFGSHLWIQTGVRKHPIGVKINDFFSHVPLKFDLWQMTLKNNRAPLLCYFKLCPSFRSHWWIQTGVTVRKRPIWVKFDDYFELCDLEIWWMTLKKNRAPFQCYFKLCASFGSHLWIQTWVTVRKHPIWVKIDDFFSRVTLPFDVWPWKTIGHLFYFASSFVHHFKTIGDFKLELQYGNAQFGSKSTIFLAVWPWNLSRVTLSRVTLKNNRAPLLCYFKLYAWF